MLYGCNRFPPHPPDTKSLRVLGSSQGLLGALMGVAHTARDRYPSIKRGARPADFLELENQTTDERSYLYSFCLPIYKYLEYLLLLSSSSLLFTFSPGVTCPLWAILRLLLSIPLTVYKYLSFTWEHICPSFHGPLWYPTPCNHLLYSRLSVRVCAALSGPFQSDHRRTGSQSVTTKVLTSVIVSQCSHPFAP